MKKELIEISGDYDGFHDLVCEFLESYNYPKSRFESFFNELLSKIEVNTDFNEYIISNFPRTKVLVEDSVIEIESIDEIWHFRNREFFTGTIKQWVSSNRYCVSVYLGGNNLVLRAVQVKHETPIRDTGGRYYTINVGQVDYDYEAFYDYTNQLIELDEKAELGAYELQFDKIPQNLDKQGEKVLRYACYFYRVVNAQENSEIRYISTSIQNDPSNILEVEIRYDSGKYSLGYVRETIRFKYKGVRYSVDFARYNEAKIFSNTKRTEYEPLEIQDTVFRVSCLVW